MRIGIVLPQTPGYSETFFRSKMAGLVAMGHQVWLFAPNGEGVHIEGVKIVEPYNKDAGSLFFVVVNALIAAFVTLFLNPRRAARFLVFERQDGRSWRMAFENLYVNAHLLRCRLDWIHFGFATMALRRENVGRSIHARQAVSFRGFDISIYPLKHRGCYDLLWKRIDRIHTISNDLLEVAYIQGLPENVDVVRIPPAIDVKNFYNHGRTGIIPPSLRILSVGRLHWKKGYEYALAAFSILQGLGVDFEATIVGEGDEYERLAFSIHQRRLNNRVFLVGRKTHTQVARMMGDYDIYIQPSVQEGFCNSVLEAQCSGLLCVVSNAEGLAENVLDGRSGLVVPCRDPEALAGAIRNLMGMADKQRLEMIEFAQSRILQEFSVENQKLQFHQFYNN